MLKGAISQGLKGSRLRSILVIVQFSISIGLITGILIVFNQINYIFNKPLGYDLENVVLLDMMKSTDGWNSEAFINELNSLPGVFNLSTAIHVPLLPGLNNAGMGKCLLPGSNSEKIDLHMLRVGDSFPQMMGMNLLAGRWFDDEAHSKNDVPIIINQAMAKQLGFDNPIDKQIKYREDGKRLRTIIGVVEDFHLKSLHSPIEPTYLMTDDDAWYILLRLDPNAISGTLTAIENIWLESGPPVPNNYQFLEDSFRQIHQSEIRFKEIFAALTLVAIFIACLGLFALAAYAAERRTKEIGIRKALGGSVSGIVTLLTKEFLVLVLISNLLSVPIAWYFMQRWLENFAYRITIELEVFLLAAAISLFIALATVIGQAVRAAVANPVESLRCE